MRDISWLDGSRWRPNSSFVRDEALQQLEQFGLLVTSSFVLHSFGIAAQNASSPWPVHDNGLNDVVEWDHYSFKINGKRLFVFSGELHYWRIPVPEVWRDILEKIKA